MIIRMLIKSKKIVSIMIMFTVVLSNICYGNDTYTKLQILENMQRECGISNVLMMKDELNSLLNSDITAQNNVKIKFLMTDIIAWLDKDRINSEIHDCCERRTIKGTKQRTSCVEKLDSAQKLDDYCSDGSNPKCKDTYNDLVNMIKAISENQEQFLLYNRNNDKGRYVSVSEYITRYMQLCQKLNITLPKEQPAIEEFLSKMSSNDQSKLKLHLTFFFEGQSTRTMYTHHNIAQRIEYHSCCTEKNSTAIDSVCSPPQHK